MEGGGGKCLVYRKIGKWVGMNWIGLAKTSRVKFSRNRSTYLLGRLHCTVYDFFFFF